MAAYDTYQLWAVTIPSAVFCFIWAVFIVIIPLFFYLTQKPVRVFVEMLQLSLPDVEEKEDNSVEVDETTITKPFYVLATLVIPLTMATVVFSFWNVWLVEEELAGDCVPNFDCFPMMGSTRLQDNPVDNCSLYFDVSSLLDSQNVTNETDVSGRVTYECYRFVFRYAEGIGAAGGVLFFTAAFSKLFFGILLALAKKADDNLCAMVLVFVGWGVGILLWLLFVLFNTVFPDVREAVFETKSDIIQFVLYSLNFAAVVVGGIIISCWELRS